MIRTWLVLAVLCTGTATGAGLTYSAASIVNASDYSAGPFAPNSVITIFGTGLARSTYALQASDIKGGMLPSELNYVRVTVQDQSVPMLYVSESQINFIMSSVQLPGPVRIRVTVQGQAGPEIPVMLLGVAPALFPMPVTGVYCIATSVDGKLLTDDAPAHGNDLVVVYVTGLGYTSPNTPLMMIPSAAAWMTALGSLKISLNGVALEPGRIKYAGVTPGSAGLYQINLEVPYGTSPDPEILIWAGDLPPQKGLKLALR